MDDYIQLISCVGYEDARRLQIERLVNDYKWLAKETNSVVVLASQLNRFIERAHTRGKGFTPQLSDLAESGAIEQAADVILFIYRKYVYSKDEEDKGLGEIIVAKHRNGPTGSVDISFISQYAKFENLSRLQTDFVPDDIPA